MAQDRYSGYSSSFTHAGGTLHLRQVRGAAVNTQKQMAEVIAAGDVDRLAAILSHADPQCRFTTADLATVLDGTISPSAGLALTGTSTIRYQLRSDGGLFAAGANHVTITSTQGFLALQSIRASQDDQQGAVAELMLYPQWGGALATPPLVLNTGQSLANAPLYNSQFFMGPVYFNAAQLEGLRSVEIDFGLQYRPKKADGDPYPRKGSVYARRPIWRLNFEKLPNINTAALFSGDVNATLAAYLWKGLHGGVREPLASTVHGKVSITAGEWGADDVTFQDEEDGSTTIQVLPTSTLAVSNASAIP